MLGAGEIGWSRKGGMKGQLAKTNGPVLAAPFYFCTSGCEKLKAVGRLGKECRTSGWTCIERGEEAWKGSLKSLLFRDAREWGKGDRWTN